MKRIILILGNGRLTIKGLVAATGRGDAGVLILSVGKRGEGATYFAHGTVTTEAVDFDLGPLGDTSQTIEGQEYVGTLALHGEEGFTEAEAPRAPLVLASALNELVCEVSSGGQEVGSIAPRRRAGDTDERWTVARTFPEPSRRASLLPRAHRRGLWLGNLSVDFPGHADVPLAGRDFKATIVAAHRDKPRPVEPK